MNEVINSTNVSRKFEDTKYAFP